MDPSILHIVPSSSTNPLLMGMLKGVDSQFAVAAFDTSNGCERSDLARDCLAEGLTFVDSGRTNTTTEMTKSTKRVIRSLRPDVVEVHTFEPCLSAALLTMSMKDRPKVLGVRHHNLNHYLQLSVGSTRPGSRRGQLGDRFINSKLDGVVSVSMAVRDTCVAEGLKPAKSYVASNGLDLSGFLVDDSTNTGISRGAQYLIVAVGRLDWQKDYPTMFRCLAELVDREIDVELAVLGTGTPTETNYLTQECSRLGVDDRVRWLGWRSDVANCLRSADVFIHSAADEAFGLVLIEAMASGLPLVATGAGGAREVVQPYYETVPIRDAPALANHVQQALEHLPERRDIANRLRPSVVERFDPQRMAEAHLEACYSVLKSDAG